MFILFHNTTVNVQPLSPPFFEKIAPQLKNSYVFSLLFFAFDFFFFIFSLIFGYPLPPWARLVPFLIDVGAIFVRFCYKLSNDEGGNDKTTPPFGKTFLRPGGMCVPNRNSRADRLQSLSRVAHSAGPVPK